MIRVRVISSDGDTTLRTVEVQGNSLSVGRSVDNDLRLDEPTVSSLHLRILSGLVVADCSSLNGTFHDGVRLKGALLISSGETIELGGTGTRLRIEAVGSDGRVIESATRVVPSAAAGTSSSEGNSTSVHSGATTPLASTRPLRVTTGGDARQQTDNLRRPSPPTDSTTGLDAAPGLLPSTAQLDREAPAKDATQRLVASPGLRASPGSTPAGGGLAGSESIATDSDTTDQTAIELRAAQGRIAELERQLDSERARTRELASRLRVLQSTAVRGVEPSRSDVPEEGAHEATGPECRSDDSSDSGTRGRADLGSAAGGVDLRRLWRAFAAHDLDLRDALECASAEEALTVEALRLADAVERMSAHLVGESLATDGREASYQLSVLAGRVLAEPTELSVRHAFRGRMDELVRRLAISPASYREAATSVVAELVGRLSEKALTGDEPLGVRARLAGRDGELWRRTGRVLAELTPEHVRERVDRLARSAGDALARHRG
ncbi:FHA domain-containing protein [Engelhardtia mirabilis]|uniref:FHA domain-containing protein n=1 Tax=Engelhardtia mirabilis TaxID=2528011 RepID=UPI003AF3AAA1